MTVKRVDNGNLLISRTSGLFEESNWWIAHEHGRDAHEFLIGFVQTMRMKQATRYDNFRKLQNIYEWGYRATSYMTSDLGSRFTHTADVPIDEDTLTYNAAANVIDTVHAKVTKTKIVPMAITSGGNYFQRTRAKELNQAVEGEFSQNDVEAIGDDVVKEGLVQGTGWAKIFSEWDRIKVEMVPAEDIVIDDGEGRYRQPRCLYHRQFVDRYVLKEIYGVDDDSLVGDSADRVRAILAAPSVDPRGQYANSHDQVEVVEAYHLPSRPLEKDDDGRYKEHDGRYAICIDGCTLVDRQWDRDRFPFAKYAPVPRRRSVWGLSLMHKLSSGEREFEKLTTKMQLAFHRMSGSHIIASRQSNVKERDLSNDVGTFIEYDGAIPPVAFNPDAVSPQSIAYVAGIPDNMMRFAGVSPLSAQQQIPAGMSNASGKALQVYEDFESERLVAYHRARERWTIDVAELMILEAREIVERNPDYKVTYQGKKAIQSVKWADVLMDQEDFVLTVFPVSMLSKTPAAKFAQLQELLNAGAITIEQFKRLFEMPDIEAENELDTADTEIVDKMLAQIVLEGKNVQPQPFDDLQMAIGRTRKFINLMRTQDGIPEKRMDALHDFLLSLQDLQASAAPQEPAQPLAPPHMSMPDMGPMPAASPAAGQPMPMS